MSRYTILLVLCIAMDPGARAPLAAGGARADASGRAGVRVGGPADAPGRAGVRVGGPAEVATLKRIASRVDGRAGVISIEASDPVAYVASQPDPRLFVIELRDTSALAFADNFKPDPRHPFAAVEVETGQAADGLPVARVRMVLGQPMRPRVRSSRNIIYVEADRLDRAVSDAGAIGTAGPSSAMRDMRVTALSATPSELQGPASPLPAPVLQVAAATQGPSPQANLAVQGGQAPSLAPPASAAQGSAQVAAPPTVAQPAAAPPPPQALATQQPGAAGPSRFTGFPVSLDFQGADLRAVLRTFAEISGLNVVIDPSIQGTVDVALRDVPWDQALDIILRANRLGYAVDGTIVRVAPLTVLADEEAQRQKLAEAQALAGTLSTVTRTLSYARAELLQPMLTATVLSQRGSITTDVRTNTLIITDLAERLARATELIGTLDRPEPQVEIEARIVQTTRDFARRLGVQWGFNGRAASELGNTLPLAFPNQVAVGGRTGVNQGPEAVGTGVNLGVSPASSAVGLALGAINGAVNLDVALSALEEAGQGRLLSTPRVTTQNNVQALIAQGVQIPIQTVANNTVTVTFRRASLTLRVTPQITAANTVIMSIEVVNESPDFSRSINNIPPIDSQEANTQLLVNNGETTVIGGIYVSREQSSQDRTPGLYRLPLLGWLFQRNEISDESRELLIFITPRIIRLQENTL